MRLAVLGANGFFPSFGRQTMSFLVALGHERLVLDAGTGFSRLGEPAVRELVAGRQRLDILLTHYHLDHVVGLAYLPALWQGAVRLWAPGTPLVDAEPEDALDRLLGPPFFPTRWRDFAATVELRELREPRLEIGGLELTLRRQPHAGGSVGVRIGDALVYATDTEPDEGTVELARGVPTLLHEVWTSREQASQPGHAARGHSSTDAVAGIARRAGARRLMPVHHHPLRDRAQLAALHAELASDAYELLTPDEGSVLELA